jgi:hypothetical protein
MSEFIELKSYARFKRLLMARQAKSFARSYIARHLAMLATCQMRVSRCTHPNPQFANGGDALRKTARYLCTFFFLCFSLGFFLKGVLDGVGDGVPENSGVGDGRTRG